VLYISLFIAGGFGVVARFVSVKGVNQILGTNFPYGTLFVNVFGSLLFGFLSWYVVQRWANDTNVETMKTVVLTGLLGGYTTFSAFSMETLQLIQAGQVFKASIYISMSLLVCVFACFLGVFLAKQVV